MDRTFAKGRFPRVSKILDITLTRSLDWALDRMKKDGFPVRARVSIQVDSDLEFMGYAKKEGDGHIIIVSSWALDSEMLGGLLVHELAHIYYIEQQMPSHQAELIQELMNGIVMKNGLTEIEARVLMDCFNHLQNILVDDAVFKIFRSEREIKMVRRFFAEWISERPTGDRLVDAALLVRNAFAIASLKRRNLFDKDSEGMSSKNQRFLTLYGPKAHDAFIFFENFLERAQNDRHVLTFRSSLSDYLEMVVDLFRKEIGGLEDLR